MKDNYICRVVLEDEFQRIEKRSYDISDFPGDAMPAVLAAAIRGLNRPRAVAFLAEIVKDSGDFCGLEASRVASLEAEEKFLDAAYEVCEAWDKLDERNRKP